MHQFAVYKIFQAIYFEVCIDNELFIFQSGSCKHWLVQKPTYSFKSIVDCMNGNNLIYTYQKENNSTTQNTHRAQTFKLCIVNSNLAFMNNQYMRLIVVELNSSFSSQGSWVTRRGLYRP